MERNDLVKVDIFDNVLGSISKVDAHKNPILHRAFSVFLINDKEEILIQKRAEHKYHSAKLWANACCSHTRLGEDLIESAQSRLIEELGMTTKLKELFSFVYMHKFKDDLFEYEYDHVLLGRYNDEIKLNLDEASEAKWVSKNELANSLLNEPEKFSSWFIICAPKVIKLLNNSDV